MTHDSRFTIHDSTNEGLHLHLHRACTSHDSYPRFTIHDSTNEGLHLHLDRVCTSHDSYPRFTIHDSTNEGLHLHRHRAGVDRVRARAVASRARAHRPPWSRSSDEAIVFASSPCTRAPGRWITGASGRTTRTNETKRPTGRRRRGRRDDRRRDDRVATDRATASNDGLTTIGFFHEFARVVSRARS